jgi:hypothetical protein
MYHRARVKHMSRIHRQERVDWVMWQGWEINLRRIIQANIDRFKELLKSETDPAKRKMEARLLAAEELKLEQLPPYDKNETKAY